MQGSIRKSTWMVGVATAAAMSAAAAAFGGGDPEINLAPQPSEWAALAHLPDWSGVWTPTLKDQDARMKSNPIPWNAAAAAQIAKLVAAEKAGNPKGLFVNCLPESMPSWMLITHNAVEFLFTPGRVTLLGESDGNRLRRIYTDGRPHPADPDPTFHGHSIGHWEDKTLVVDTVGVLPETYIASSEAVGLPNNGDMHIVERIHLVGPDTLNDDLEISAPHVLTRTWKTKLILFRQRAKKYDIVEGVCLQGNYSEGKDAAGNAVFVPALQSEGGNTLPEDK
ncbi:MAG: hypothetical protein JSR66_20455 [Proteobacteria bacterium]|nr:hypothetical protein [Pseudomonadota bacterium]